MDKIKFIFPILVQVFGFLLILGLFTMIYVSNSNCSSYKSYDIPRIVLGSFYSVLMLISYKLTKNQKILIVFCLSLFILSVIYTK